MSDVKIKELDKSLIHRANSNSMSGQRGDISAHEYEVYCQKVMSWNIPDSRKQKIVDQIYTRWSEQLRHEAAHVSVAVAGPARYNAKKLDHSDTILRLSSEFVEWFNGWLKEADSLAEREAIECCIDHIQDTPAVSQQELRSYMLPWFSPFAAPWCGKIQRAFPKAYVTMNFELILVPRTNTYINLNHCSTPDEFKAEVIEGVSRFAFKAFTKPLCKEHLDGINKLLDTHFTPEEIEYIYTNLGNCINHELCMKFVKSGYDLKVIEESV